MVSYNQNDLQFILDQIMLSEQHATTEDANGTPVAGTSLDQLIPNPLLPWGVRTVDGTYNNVIPGRETWGAADLQFPRLLEPEFRDGEIGDPDGPGPAPAMPSSYEQTSGLEFDSQPRIISNLIVDQTANNPAAVAAAQARDGSTFVMRLAENGNFSADLDGTDATVENALGIRETAQNAIEGWTSSRAFVLDPADNANLLGHVPDAAGDNQVAMIVYADGAAANPEGFISTVIGQYLEGVPYEVSFDIYTRANGALAATDYSVEILVGGTSLGVQTATAPTSAEGSAANVSFTFDPSTLDPAVAATLTKGDDVELVITNTGGGDGNGNTQIYIDNVHTNGDGLFFIPN